MWKSIWMIPLMAYLIVLTGCVVLFWAIQKGRKIHLPEKAEHLFNAISAVQGYRLVRVVSGILFTGIIFLIPYIKFTFRIGEVVKKSTQDPVLAMIVFYWAVWWLVLLAAGMFRLAFNKSWKVSFAGALVLMGMTYEIFMRMQVVTTYPFSLGWSETSRYYYGSLYLSRLVYGVNLPLSSLHPTRYLLQAFPFLISGLGLFASRIWQFFLWISLTALTAGSLAWRSILIEKNRGKAEGHGLKFLFAGWFFLFLLRVGVYYHLEVMVFLPLFFVSARHPWRSLLVLITSSIWAGVSRVNWFPVPAMLAIMLYLLEEPVSAYKSIWKYLAIPSLWAVLGPLLALAAQAAYIPLSGNENNIQAFASSFTSAKLWYRLWPNDSFAPGIIPAILMIGSPLIVAIVMATVQRNKALHPIRWLGLWGMLAVLFAGGLVVSVKIGGGSDLHNMDAFAVSMLVTAAYFTGNAVRQENDATQPWKTLPWPATAWGLLLPLIFLVPMLSPLPKYNHNFNQQAFSQLKKMAEDAGKNGPVLFINERHLITFHQINLPLVPEYEAVTLMEMAMSGNQSYMQSFYADLKNHHFAAIVAGKQNIGIKEEGSFAEENNIWNTQVSPYILCYYEPVIITTTPETIAYIEADDSRIAFYIPRTSPGVCP